MTEQDISAEKRIIEDAGCSIAVWSPDLLVIRYHNIDQRQQLISNLKSLGWLYCVDTPGETGAKLLSIRRTLPEEGSGSDMLMEAPLSGRIIMGVFLSLFLGIGLYRASIDFNRHNTDHGILTIIAFVVIAAVALYSGLKSTTLKVWLSPQQIILATIFRKITLQASDVQKCEIKTFYSRGSPYFSFHFTMKDGMVYTIPAPSKGFQNFKDELKKRYSFSVHS